MSSILIIGVVVVVIVLVVLGLLAKAKVGADSTPAGEGSHYELRSPFFSPAERSFLGVLESALPDGIGLLAKVRLGDVFKTAKGLTPSLRSSANNRLNQKHIDFLLVRTTDLSPVAGVELDDSSHERADRKARDTFVDDVFRASNLPLLHVPVKASYSPIELRQSLAELLKIAKGALKQ